MELTEAMIDEIRRGFREVEYGRVTIEIEGRGPGQGVDISVTARRRYQAGNTGAGPETPGPGLRRQRVPGREKTPGKAANGLRRENTRQSPGERARATGR